MRRHLERNLTANRGTTSMHQIPSRPRNKTYHNIFYAFPRLRFTFRCDHARVINLICIVYCIVRHPLTQCALNGPGFLLLPLISTLRFFSTRIWSDAPLSGHLEETLNKSMQSLNKLIFFSLQSSSSPP